LILIISSNENIKKVFVFKAYIYQNSQHILPVTLTAMLFCFQNTMMQYLASCMTILRNIVHHDYALRHKLAHDMTFYHTILRGENCRLHISVPQSNTCLSYTL